jgi:hypothetical protein
VSSGQQLDTTIDSLRSHFASGGGPVMAGGDLDCSSKCIVGQRAAHLIVVVSFSIKVLHKIKKKKLSREKI